MMIHIALRIFLLLGIGYLRGEITPLHELIMKPGVTAEEVCAYVSQEEHQKHVDTYVHFVDCDDERLVLEHRKYTPLIMATLLGRDDVVRVLIDHGANIHLLSHKKRNALHWAIKEGHSQIAHLLLEQWTAVEAPDYRGDTPLHMAAATGNLELVEELVQQRGASRRARNKYGYMPWYHAKLCGHTEVYQWLLLPPVVRVHRNKKSSKVKTKSMPPDDLGESGESSSGIGHPPMTSCEKKRMMIPEEKREVIKSSLRGKKKHGDCLAQ